MKNKILIIEDNAIWQQKYKKWLGAEYSYAFAANTEDACLRMEQFIPDLVIQDLGLPHIDQGLQLLNQIVSSTNDVKVIVITSSQDHQHALEAQRRGAYSYFFKGENIEEELPLLVRGALRMQKLERENKELRHKLDASLQFENIIAVSKQMQNILRLIEKTRATREPVLITGESGVGKEVLARHIHQRSMPAQAPFITLNAATLPENLLENELFGHEKGAFTGATDLKHGLFELAENGTLFLDEIGELPIQTQAKLLRVLQEKTFYRLGGQTEIRANFRLIAATNRVLTEAIEQKLFREDLYYRLNVIPIHIPPLRERPDDIPALINFFVERYAENYNLKKIPKIDPAVIAYLSRVDWKGNIRELENTLTRMLVINSEHLTLKDIPSDIEERENSLLRHALEHGYTLEEMTRMYIHAVYEHVNRNKKEACKFLNINYRTLTARLDKS